jgi:hypothetical protein
MIAFTTGTTLRLAIDGGQTARQGWYRSWAA